MNPAEIPNRRPFGITEDGCQKNLKRYASCGRTLGKVAQPHFSSYLGKCHDAVDKTLTSLGRPTVQPVAGQTETACGVSLACARPYAAKSDGVTDIKFLTTCTCLHTVPGKGCFIGVETNKPSTIFCSPLSFLGVWPTLQISSGFPLKVLSCYSDLLNL